jgi:hypothetical protein
MVYAGFVWLRIKTVVGSCECDNEPSGSIKYGKFLEELRTIRFSGGTLLHGVSQYICYVN